MGEPTLIFEAVHGSRAFGLATEEPTGHAAIDDWLVRRRMQ